MKTIVLRVFEAFAGYGSQHLALKKFQDTHPEIHFEVVGRCDIDDASNKAYSVLNGDIRNYYDITTINWGNVPSFDLFFYTFPCTDISWTGLRKGFEEGSGTRSSLLWECKKAIMTKKPKYLVMENVKSILYNNKPKYSERSNRENLDLWIRTLENKGYKSIGLVMNASDFGIPQHRERFILISVLGEDPLEITSDKKDIMPLVNILERKVSKEYYLKAA